MTDDDINVITTLIDIKGRGWAGRGKGFLSHVWYLHDKGFVKLIEGHLMMPNLTFVDIWKLKRQNRWN